MTILSWIAATITLISVYLVGKKHPFGQLLGVFGCCIWIVEMWSINCVQVVLNVIFVLLYLKNYLNWINYQTSNPTLKYIIGN